MAGRPGFQWLWQHYPRDPTLADDRSAILNEIFEGKHNLPWILSAIRNTCVVRIARAMNYAGAPIVNSGGLNCLKGADGKWYPFRVSEFIPYLEKRFGDPDIHTIDASPAASLGAVMGHRGIIAFRVSGWSDATGHLDLWNMAMPRYKAYFKEADEVMLWKC